MSHLIWPCGPRKSEPQKLQSFETQRKTCNGQWTGLEMATVLETAPVRSTSVLRYNRKQDNGSTRELLGQFGSTENSNQTERNCSSKFCGKGKTTWLFFCPQLFVSEKPKHFLRVTERVMLMPLKQSVEKDQPRSLAPRFFGCSCRVPVNGFDSYQFWFQTRNCTNNTDWIEVPLAAVRFLPSLDWANPTLQHMRNKSLSLLILWPKITYPIFAHRSSQNFGISNFTVTVATIISTMKINLSKRPTTDEFHKSIHAQEFHILPFIHELPFHKRQTMKGSPCRLKVACSQ